MQKIDQATMAARLMRVVSMRGSSGGLPNIPANIRPALEQIANSQISLHLFSSLLNTGLRAKVQWDHYGIAVSNAGIYSTTVHQLIDLGYIDSGLQFAERCPISLLVLPTNPRIPIKVFVNSNTNMAVGQLDYLAFTLGQYFRYSGHPGFNKEFEGLITEGRQSLVGQEFLGVEQRGVIYSREEVAGWGTTQEGIFDGFDFPTILILDRPTAGF